MSVQYILTMNKYLILIISGSVIPAVLLALTLLTYYDFFTPVAKENSYGVNAYVSKSPPTMLCKCPYLISFSTKYTVAINGFYACKGLFCVRQMSPIVLYSPPYESHATTAIDSINVPWHVGDNVDIRLKVAPVHDYGTEFSDWQASMIDLGPSQVIAP